MTGSDYLLMVLAFVCILVNSLTIIGLTTQIRNLQSALRVTLESLGRLNAKVTEELLMRKISKDENDD